MDNAHEARFSNSFNDEPNCPLPVPSTAIDDETITSLLGAARTIAVVGASPRTERISHQITLWLMDHTPYEVYLVNPNAPTDEIRGHGFYSSLAELPVAPHIVDVFRRSEEVVQIAQDAIDVGAAALWMQLGVTNLAAAEAAAEADLVVVQNRCIKVEYERLRDDIESQHVPAG